MCLRLVLCLGGGREGGKVGGRNGERTASNSVGKEKEQSLRLMGSLNRFSFVFFHDANGLLSFTIESRFIYERVII